MVFAIFKRYKVLGFVIKLIIAVSALYYIYYKVVSHQQLNDFKEQLYDVLDNRSSVFLLIIIFLMMPLNWVLEAAKWNYLIKKLEDIGFLRSLKAVLSGLALGIFTPSRVGEFGGKLFNLDKADRFKGFVIAMISSLSQFITTLFFGIIGLIYYVFHYASIAPEIEKALIAVSVLLLIVTIWMYSNVSFVGKGIKRKSKYSIAKYLVVLRYYKPKELILVFLISSCR